MSTIENLYWDGYGRPPHRNTVRAPAPQDSGELETVWLSRTELWPVFEPAGPDPDVERDCRFDLRPAHAARVEALMADAERLRLALKRLDEWRLARSKRLEKGTP